MRQITLAPTFECETCTREFKSGHAVNQHMSAAGHAKPKVACETCNRMFYTRKSADQHMNTLGHWKPTIPCETCSQMFRTQSTADQHMEEQDHYKDYCKDCNRRFRNKNDLQMHLKSKVHLGTNISCPFCNNNFTMATGLVHHLERGSCSKAPMLNRATILRMVRERDQNGVIANKQIEWREEENGQYSATSRAFNGSKWESYICHKLFRGSGGLNQHVNSPVHQQNVYHCPNKRANCSNEFSTLAALFNHLESESCAFIRFAQVQQQVHGVIRGQRLLGL